MKYLNKFATELEYDKATDLSYPNISYIVENDKIMWSDDDVAKYRSVPLAFIALDDNVMFINTLQMAYGINQHSTWYVLRADSPTPAINAGDIIYLRALSPITPSSSRFNQFTATGRFAALGNPLSMIYGLDFADVTDVSSTDSIFLKMFRDCTGLTDASHIALAASKLGLNSYREMFRHCPNLTAAPALPATTLADYCYCNMFYECPNLAEAPVLPAITLASHCYQYLFYGCSSLTEAPALPAETLVTYCYNGMFRACTGLTTAPALPAETLANGCYNTMFQECSSLNNINCRARTGISDSNTTNWVNGVAATGTFTKDSDANWSTGVNGIPDGWSVVDE